MRNPHIARLVLLARSQRLPLAVVIAAAVLGGIVLVAQSSALTLLIDRVFLGHQTLRGGALLILALLLAAMLKAGLIWLGSISAQMISSRTRVTLRKRLLARIFDRGPLFLTGERTGELTTTVVNGVEELDAFYSQYLPQMAISALVPALILAVVFPIDVISGLTLLLTAPLIPVFGALVGALTSTVTKHQWSTLSRLSAHFLDVLQGLTTLKLFGRSRRQSEIIARISDDYRRATMKTLRVAFLSALTLELVATLSVAVVAVEVGLRLLYSDISFPRALFVLLLAPEFYLPLRALGAKYHAAASGISASERVFELIEDEAAPSHQLVSPEAYPQLEGPLAITFQNVQFTYPGSERAALTRVSFEIPAGARVAVVGPTGSGKSTLANLLLRFAEPDEGEILVNGAQLRQMNPRSWREHVAWVPQRPHLFHDTVASNIKLARKNASDDDVRYAAALAQAGDFIEQLPRGYETVIGEDGSRLSGGQAQRVALARAFLRDAPLLILDEPTSQLDPESEKLITEATERLACGRTTFVIAHRLNTVITADMIITLEHGRVAAIGTHQHLLATSEMYRKLIAASGEGVAA